MRVIGAAFVYFLLVFAVGFVLGVLRTFWAAPRLGARRAEIAEAPLMLVAAYLACRWVVALFALPSEMGARIMTGGLALLLMLTAEFALVRPLRGLTLRRYLSSRDPVAAVVYYASLLVFALMPIMLAGYD